jgi:hypothetical protein
LIGTAGAKILLKTIFSHKFYHNFERGFRL